MSELEKTLDMELQEKQDLGLKQHILHYENDAFPKPRNLLHALELYRSPKALIFCLIQEKELLEKYLQRFGYRVQLHDGDKPYVIITTDALAQKNGFQGMSHLFNYDLPTPESYLARTQYVHENGILITLTNRKFLDELSSLQTQLGILFQEMALPPLEEVNEMQAERLSEALKEEASRLDISPYRAIAQAMTPRGDIADVLGFLLREYYRLQPPLAFSMPNKPKDRPKPKENQVSPEPIKPAIKQPAAPMQRAPKEPRPPRVDPVTKVYVTLGKQDGLADLTSVIHYMSRLSGVDIGHFTGMGQVRDTSSHVELDTEVIEALVKAMHGKTKEGAQAQADAEVPVITCEIAKDQPQSKSYRR